MSLEQERLAVLEFVYAHGPLSIANLRNAVGSHMMTTVSVMIHFQGILTVDGPRDPDGGWDDEALVQLSPKGVEEVLNAPPTIKPPTGSSTSSKKVVKKPKSAPRKKLKSAAYRKVQAACQLAESRTRDGHTPRWCP